MKKLGISVYVGRNSIERDLNYIKTAARYGFSRIFTCFLNLSEDNKEEFLSDFKAITSCAKEYNFEVAIDVTPAIFNILNASYENLAPFKALGVDIIRLDEGFDGAKEAAMTFNKENIKLEINSSTGTKYLDNIFSFKPNKENIVACHNFYPREFTGLSTEGFLETSKQIKSFGLRSAAFVSSQAKGTFSTQDVVEGLPTLEHHRYKSITSQAKELFYSLLIDDVIIGNAYASEEEIKELSLLSKELITLNVKPQPNISDLEREIAGNNLHMFRGDYSEYIIRSTMMRIKYKNDTIEPNNTKDLKFGDITIDNNNYGRYKGEVHIALKDMKNKGGINVIGSVVDDELDLIKYITPWSKFKLNIL